MTTAEAVEHLLNLSDFARDYIARPLTSDRESIASPRGAAGARR